MKKFLAFTLALVMALSLTAFAESTTSAESSGSVESSVSVEITPVDISGLTVPDDWTRIEIADRGISFSVPADMNISEPDTGINEIWHGTSGDMTMIIGVFSGAASWDDVNALITNGGLSYNDVNMLDLGFEHEEIYSTDDPTHNAVAFIDGNGDYCAIECYLTSDDGSSTFFTMLKSFAITEPAVTSETAESSAEG